MSDDGNTGRPRPIPHTRLYVGAGALFAAAAFAIAVIIFDPTAPGMPSAAAACAVMATLIINGTASIKRYERYDAARRDETTRILAAIEADAAERRAHIHEMFGHMGTLAYDFRRVVAFAEQGIGISHDVSGALDDVNKRIDDLTAIWGGLAALDDSEESNVFPLPSKETREAAQRLARRLIQREEDGR